MVILIIRFLSGAKFMTNKNWGQVMKKKIVGKVYCTKNDNKTKPINEGEGSFNQHSTIEQLDNFLLKKWSIDIDIIMTRKSKRLIRYKNQLNSVQ